MNIDREREAFGALTFDQWWAAGGHRLVSKAAAHSGWEGAAEAGYIAGMLSAGTALAAALRVCHDTLHECTAVLSGQDCKKVSAAMAAARAALSAQEDK